MRIFLLSKTVLFMTPFTPQTRFPQEVVSVISDLPEQEWTHSCWKSSGKFGFACLSKASNYSPQQGPSTKVDL